MVGGLGDRAPAQLREPHVAQLGLERLDTDQIECNLDDFGMLPCSSPTIYRKLKRGKHTFAVRATAGGTTDRSPVRYSWKIKKKKRKR